MTKRDFLLALNDALGSMTGDERSAAIKYYSDYIDDAGPENLENVLQELGSPEQVAASILADADAAQQAVNGAAAAEASRTMPPPSTACSRRDARLGMDTADLPVIPGLAADFGNPGRLAGRRNRHRYRIFRYNLCFANLRRCTHLCGHCNRIFCPAARAARYGRWLHWA